MKITIENKGLETILNTLLSCRCPIDNAVELALFQAYHRVKHQEVIDFNEILEIADKNSQRTPLHLLLDFCAYSKDDLSSFTITHNDTIRYSCSGYHFNHFKGNIDPFTVRDTASYLIGHMIVPARLEKDVTTLSATYVHDDHTVIFDDIIVPPNLEFSEDQVYGIHLATAVTNLSPIQEKMVLDHLSNIPGYKNLLESIKAIDYSDFQAFGNYRAQVQIRIDQNFDKN